MAVLSVRLQWFTARLCSLLPASPRRACCELLRMGKSIPQHPMNPALLDLSGDTREAKRKDSHSVKESAWITTTEGEGGKRNALFGTVSLIPIGCHQSKGNAWGEKKVNYQLLPLPGTENHIILLKHLEDLSLKTLWLYSTTHAHFHFIVARWKPSPPLFAHGPFVSIAFTPQSQECSYRMYRHHLYSFIMRSLFPNSIWVCKPNSFNRLSHEKLSCSPCQPFLFSFQSEFFLHLYG